MFGLLNIYKPVGKTSHDVVAYLRIILKIKQIGHTGTLDPFAEGVLPICIGKSTRLIEYLPDDKAYLAFVKFGKSTDTYDIEGQTTFSTDKKVTVDGIKTKLQNFKGEIEQLPPIYSAIKVNGKKLYDYAREGKEVEVKPRKVVINNIELKSFDYEAQIAQIYIECSKGTYIRSIAHDLGKALDNGAHLVKLIRTKVGNFNVENAIKLEDIKTQEDVSNNLIDPLQVLSLPKYELNDIENEKVSHGQQLLNKSMKSVDFLILVYNNRIKAVATANEKFIKVIKVF